jgi:plasmid stabilization system protein ParE
MLPILWRAEAQADLAAILEYIAERNPQSALDLYDDIKRVVSQLPHHPLRGSSILDLQGQAPPCERLHGQPTWPRVVT